MKARFFAPIAVLLVCLLCLVSVNLAFPKSLPTGTEVANYLIKPLHVDRVLFVQPRLSTGNLAPESLWVALEEIAQRYYINDSKLHVRHVNGRDIPGLLVFTSPLTAEAPTAGLIADET